MCLLGEMGICYGKGWFCLYGFNKREKKSSIWIKNTAVKQENGVKHSTLPVNNSTVKTA